MSTGTRYRIIDDSGVDYAFINQPKGSWLGAIVEGWPAAHLPDHITVRQPPGFLEAAMYTAPAACFERYDMKITLDEWLELEEAAEEAAKKINQLYRRITTLWQAHADAGNDLERELLLKLESRIGHVLSDLAVNLFHVQSEWTGGDSGNPRNFTLREPNWVPIAHAFPREQVDKYRDPKTGEIRIPHRTKPDDSTKDAG